MESITTAFDIESEKLTKAWALFVSYYEGLNKGEKKHLRTYAKDVSVYKSKGQTPRPARIAKILQASGYAEVECELRIQYLIF